MFQPVTGTDDILTHSESKRAYLTLLNNIVSSKLAGIFLSDRKCFSYSRYTVLVTSDDAQATKTTLSAYYRACSSLPVIPQIRRANG